MDKNEEKYNETEHIEESNQATEETASSEAQDAPMTDEQQIALLQEQLEREKKEYLFLMAEFDNFRKRVVKEKADRGDIAYHRRFRTWIEGCIRD